MKISKSNNPEWAYLEIASRTWNPFSSIMGLLQYRARFEQLVKIEYVSLLPYLHTMGLDQKNLAFSMRLADPRKTKRSG